MTVVTLFEEQVRKHPGSPALVLRNDEWTYAELNSAANTLASLLERRGIGPGARVGLCFKRSFEQIAAIIAVLKAGAAYIPIDPTYPTERIRHIITDSGMEILVTGGTEEVSLPVFDLSVISYHDAVGSVRDDPGSLPSGRPGPDDLAYIIYTSGSTGLPKGAMVTHRNLAWYIDTAAGLFGYDKRDTWALIHSYGFDVSVWEIWGSLGCGGRLVIVPEDVVSDPPSLIRLLEERRVTVLSITPAAFYAYLDADRIFARNTVPTLRLVFIGGERLDFPRLMPWLEKYGDARPGIYNMYGPTETTIYVTAKHVGISDAEPGKGSSIGTPLPGIRIILADEEGNPVPEGEKGEILIAGEGVGKGYLNRPSLTGEKFLPDRERPGGLIYRSGDLARRQPDGEIEYLGRIDRQLKIRGHRVEPGEIEAILRQHRSVLDAAVIPQTVARDTIRLIGYVVPSHGQTIDETEIQGYLQFRLPHHMVCSRILSLSTMPLNPHGKVDRDALPLPDPGPGDREATYVRPRDERERLLAAVFSEVTGVPEVGIRDNFFRLGGNSLSAVRLVARIREYLGIWLDIRMVFTYPTIEALALTLDWEDTGSVPMFHFRHLDRSRSLPLTFSQERVWLIQQRNPDTVAYNFEAGIRFHGDFNAGILEDCLKKIVARHEVYRSTFHLEAGRPVQRVHPQGLVICGHSSLEHLDREEGLAFIEEWRQKRVTIPFRPEELPLIEWHLFRLSPTDHLLLHREHHLLHDGWSFFLFMRDLLTLYRAAAAGEPAELPPLSYQIADFADAQRRWLQEGGAESQRRFWRQRLEGCPELLTLPWDHPRPPRASMDGGSIRFGILPDVIGEIEGLAGASGMTPFIVMAGVFALLMGRYSGMKEVCFGSGVANRRHQESEGIIGMIINNLVLRVDLTPGVTFREFLLKVRDVVMDALSNQDLPFDQMVTLPGIKSNESYPPVCQVLFSSYDGPLYEHNLGALQVETELVLPVNAAKFDLNVILIRQPVTKSGTDRRGMMTMIWEYATDLFERETVEQMSRHYLTILQNALQDPDRCIEQIPLLDPVEREVILALSRGSDAPYPGDDTLADLWERQVLRSQDRIALVSGDTAWSYGELNAWANRIAWRLKEAGVTPGCVVGCCLPRGPEAIAAILGTLKAGGAYLPLNPDDPDDRILYLVRDSGTFTVILNRDQIFRFSGLDGVDIVEMEGVGDSSEVNPPVSGSGSGLACIMYTSGSTGRPKGVEVTNRGIIRLFFGVDYARFREDQRVLQMAPLSFDASSFEIWGALLHGGILILFPEDVPDPAVLEREILKHTITTMWLNASLFNYIIDERPQALAPLRQLLIGGEPLSAAHVRRAYAFLPDTSLVNGYGPTENTTFTCCYPIPRNLPESLVSIPLGRPISHTSVYVLDRHLQLVPFGVTGELFLGGDGVARGYRGKPDLTRDYFIPDPFSGSRETKMYKSGDLGSLNKDGTLQFRGRADRQLKIRGFRIEPAEIEAAISLLPHIRQCVVEATGNPAGDRQLIAYIVMEEGYPLDITRIRSSLREKLPEYLIPNVFLRLDRLPIGITGKLDTKGLPVPTTDGEKWPWLAFLKYRSMHEVIVRQIFEELLNTKDIGPDDDFFELGGHSLQLLKLSSMVYEIFGVQFEIRLLFPSPTVARVCEAITKSESVTEDTTETNACIVAIKKYGSRPPVFIMPGGTGDDFSLAMYARLAPYLPDDRPMYGFRTRDAHENWLVPYSSVEEMATTFIRGIRRIQPNGPYNIAGGCIGGVIAFEMGRQLIESGQDVERLILLEAWPPDFTGYLRMIKRNWCTRARFLIEDNLLRGDPMGRLGKLTVRIAPNTRGSLIRKGPDIYNWILTNIPWHWEDIPNELKPEWSIFHRMVLRYQPKLYRGSLYFFESRTPYRSGAPEIWKQWVQGDVEIRHTEGNHLTYLTENIHDTGVAFGSLFEDEDHG